MYVLELKICESCFGNSAYQYVDAIYNFVVCILMLFVWNSSNYCDVLFTLFLLISLPCNVRKMAVVHVLPTAVLLLVCWRGLQAQGQQLGNAVSHCWMDNKEETTYVQFFLLSFSHKHVYGQRTYILTLQTSFSHKWNDMQAYQCGC